MNEHVSVVINLIGDVIESTDRASALSAVVAGSLIIPFYLFKEQPDLSIVTVFLLAGLWVYTAFGLCFVLYVLEWVVSDAE